LSDPGDDEQLLSLYLTGHVLDKAEQQAHRAGIETVQEYCTVLLREAIEAEHVRDQVAEVEARRGAFEGLLEVAEDPEFLAELTAASGPREGSTADNQEPRADSAGAQPLTLATPFDALAGPAAQAILRHAGQAGDDPYAFLTCLRRGESVPPAALAELADALRQLEAEYLGERAMDRRLTFALHRLAFESQILHTDAWPGIFDGWTLDTIHAVQEAVERILSGQDIRYFQGPPADEGRPEATP
jgi:hypothetical protein